MEATKPIVIVRPREAVMHTITLHEGGKFHGSKNRNWIDDFREERAVSKPTIKELRKMAQDKIKAAWIGLALTVVIQAIILSAWVGSVAERVEQNNKKIEVVVGEQKVQANLVYGLPYLQQSVTEIKGDVKELKQLVLQGNNNQQRRQP